MRAAFRPLLLVCFGLVRAGCGAAPPPRPASPPPPVAIPFVPGEVGCCTTLDQRVLVSVGPNVITFDVVVETHGDELVLVGFTTYGIRAFVVVHDASGLHVEAEPIPELGAVPFDRVVRDVYAAFLFGPGTQPRDPSVRFEDEGTREILRRRTVVFEANSPSPDRVEIDYSAGGFRAGGPPPANVVVHHVGTTLRIEVTTRPSTPSARPVPGP